MKRGFTLAEILGVTVLLAIIVALAYPLMINIFETKQGEIDSYKEELIENAAINYAKNNINEYPYVEKQNGCIFLKKLVDQNLVGYQVEEKLYNRIVKINYGVNNKYSAELLKEGETCASYGIDTYSVKTCTKKDPSSSYELVDNKFEYYINNELKKQIHKINAKNISSEAIFQVQSSNYKTLESSLKYTNGVNVQMDQSKEYFEMYVEFDMTVFTGFTDIQKNALINAPIFYNSETESLDTTCNE